MIDEATVEEIQTFIENSLESNEGDREKFNKIAKNLEEGVL